DCCRHALGHLWKVVARAFDFQRRQRLAVLPQNDADCKRIAFDGVSADGADGAGHFGCVHEDQDRRRAPTRGRAIVHEPFGQERSRMRSMARTWSASVSRCSISLLAAAPAAQVSKTSTCLRAGICLSQSVNSVLVTALWTRNAGSAKAARSVVLASWVR